MRALLIFPKDDVIANVAVILSGVLFGVLDNRYLDLVIVFVIAVVVLRGGIKILKEAAEYKKRFSL